MMPGKIIRSLLNFCLYICNITQMIRNNFWQDLVTLLKRPNLEVVLSLYSFTQCFTSYLVYSVPEDISHPLKWLQQKIYTLRFLFCNLGSLNFWVASSVYIICMCLCIYTHLPLSSTWTGCDTRSVFKQRLDLIFLLLG